MSSDLEQIIADQMAQIEELRSQADPYWPRVYDDIRAAWDKWALAELGTSTPTDGDLAGRPELRDLWDAVR